MKIKRGTRVKMVESGRIGVILYESSYMYDRPAYRVELDGAQTDFWPYEFEVLTS